MAKLKTFADGELLTASDINTHLNPDVPDGATVYDTGPVTLATGIVARRIGCQVEVVGNVSGSFATATLVEVLAPSVMPADMRPNANRWATAFFPPTTNGAVTVSSAGQIRVVQSSGATRTSGVQFSIVYFV